MKFDKKIISVKEVGHSRNGFHSLIVRDIDNSCMLVTVNEDTLEKVETQLTDKGLDVVINIYSKKYKDKWYENKFLTV